MYKIEGDPNDFMLSVGILAIHSCYIFIQNTDQVSKVAY